MKIYGAFCIVFTTASMSFCNFPTSVPIPPQEAYKQFPPGAFFTINNTQNLTTHETRREVTITPAPVIVQPTPPSQPQTIVQHTSSETKSENYLVQAVSWITNWKNNVTLKAGALVAGTVALAYGFLCTKLFLRTAKAQKKNGWGSFQEHISPQQLTAIPLLKLAEGLVEEIIKKYPPTNPNVLMPSLLAFNKDLELELEELTSFIELRKQLESLKITLFFPAQKKLITQVQTKIQRLHIFKEALSEWITEHTTRLMRNKAIPKNNEVASLSFELTTDAHESAVIEVPLYT